MAPEEPDGLPDPDQIPHAIIWLDYVLALVVAATLFFLVTGYAWHHVGAALIVALGLVAIVSVTRRIARKEREAHRID
jgi:membrane protein YdbS with pleckstrin-like domain